MGNGCYNPFDPWYVKDSGSKIVLTSCNAIDPLPPDPSIGLEQHKKPPIVENYIVVWLTSNIDEDKNSIQQIRRLFTSFRLFTNIDEFFALIIKIKEEKLFLILSEEVAEKIAPLVHHMSQLVAIYIISYGRSIDEQWIEQHPKIQGVFTEIEPICEELICQIHLSKYDIIPFEIINPSLFNIQYLLKDILLHEITFNVRMKREFIDFAREEYPKELHIINAFELNYGPDDAAVWWFTRKCFLNFAMHEAFRTQNIKLLLKMGIFIRDVYQRTDETYSRKVDYVYQGQGISENELELISKNRNGLLSFNNFFWTNINRQISLRTAHMASNNPNIYGVLFRIEISSLRKYISLEKPSFYLNSEEEILSSIYCIFRIGKIKRIEEKIWEIDLVYIDDKDPQLDDYVQSVKNLEGKTSSEKLGFYFIGINQLDKAEDVYKTLLDSNSINDPKQLALLNEQLGFIYHKKSDGINSLRYYEAALKNYLTFLSKNDTSLLPIYLNIGILLQHQQNFKEAIKYLKCALTVSLHSAQQDYSETAKIYHRIAKNYDEQGILVEAIENYQLALQTELECTPFDHVWIAKTCNDIGMSYYRSDDYTRAISYYEKSLRIQKKTLSPNDLLLAETNHKIAMALVGSHQSKEAIEYASRAVNIARHSFGANHDDVQLYENYLKQLRRKTLIGVVPNGAVYE